MAAAHEMAAIRMIVRLPRGETQYYSQFGHMRKLWPNWDLRPAARRGGAGMTPKNLADGKASGFIFTAGRVAYWIFSDGGAGGV